MISSREIKRQALKWWKEILQSVLDGVECFPKEITRISKIKPGTAVREFEKIHDELNALRSDSKEKIGFGYTVMWEEIANRKIGQNPFPQKIVFETLIDYLKFLKKEKEFKDFKTISAQIISAIPQLKGWISLYPETVIGHCDKWGDLLKVLKYFIENPKPDLYIRQLPIPLHTKFIEQNQALLASCLDYLIPSSINVNEKSFQRRFNLKYDKPLIRMRILDDSLTINGLTDLSIPVSQFKTLEINCSNVVVTENKINFLSLQALPKTIAIWSGGGFYIRYFANVEWLKCKSIFYWGDIDAHGLLILDQLRGYFHQTKGVLMDWDTLHRFKSEIGDGQPISDYSLSNLTPEERSLFDHVRENSLRLEQEKIPYDYSVEALTKEILGN